MHAHAHSVGRLAATGTADPRLAARAYFRMGVSVLALALLAVGCAVPAGSRSSGSEGPTTRCLGQPGRGESYSSDHPLFFLFCVESP